MNRLLASEFLKIKRKMILFLVVLGPLGVIGLQAINFGLRYDWLTHVLQDDLWGGLIEQVASLAVAALMIGLTIITSMIATIEHQTNAWKQLLALPITKSKVLTGKVLLALLLLAVSCLLLIGGTIILGLALQFGTDIPYSYLVKMTFLPYIAAVPFIIIQTWLAISIKNQAIPLTFGIIGTIITLFSTSMPLWIPWSWPFQITETAQLGSLVITALGTGLFLYIASLVDFARKDVM